MKELKEEYPEHKSLVDCIRYIENRKTQFAYDKAIAKGLPIGSRKIESTHRNIIQQRMKKPRAWWKSDLAEAMINLRIRIAEVCKTRAQPFENVRAFFYLS